MCVCEVAAVNPHLGSQGGKIIYCATSKCRQILAWGGWLLLGGTIPLIGVQPRLFFLSFTGADASLAGSSMSVWCCLSRGLAQCRLHCSRWKLLWAGDESSAIGVGASLHKASQKPSLREQIKLSSSKAHCRMTAMPNEVPGLDVWQNEAII